MAVKLAKATGAEDVRFRCVVDNASLKQEEAA